MDGKPCFIILIVAGLTSAYPMPTKSPNRTTTCGQPPSLNFGSSSGSCTYLNCQQTYTCQTNYVTTSSPTAITCQSDGSWTALTFSCVHQDACQTGYLNSYSIRANWFFDPPVNFTPSISGGNVDANHCKDACTQTSNCVAAYYRKLTGGYCILRSMRSFESPTYAQYDNVNSAWDEYIRNCA